MWRWRGNFPSFLKAIVGLLNSCWLSRHIGGIMGNYGIMGEFGWNYGELWGIMVELWGIMVELWGIMGELWGDLGGIMGELWGDLGGIMGNYGAVGVELWGI